MTDDPAAPWSIVAFLFFFAGLWLASTTMLGFLSGWFALQGAYADDRMEEPLLTLRGRSGSMGLVGIGGILTLRAYPSGLGIGIFRIFGPFQKPLRIPWNEIDAEQGSSFFLPTARLQLGSRGGGTLKIGTGDWARLVNAVPPLGKRRGPQMPRAISVDRGSVARAMFLQWLVILCAGGTFLYVMPRLNGQMAGVPLAVCIGFPALVIGAAQLVRYLRER